MFVGLLVCLAILFLLTLTFLLCLYIFWIYKQRKRDKIKEILKQAMLNKGLIVLDYAYMFKMSEKQFEKLLNEIITEDKRFRWI